jgi:hypothetical protein
VSLADEILTMVHAFGDTGRKEAVRDIASRVAELEARDVTPDLAVAIERERAERAEALLLEMAATTAVQVEAPLLAKLGEAEARAAALAAMLGGILRTWEDAWTKDFAAEVRALLAAGPEDAARELAELRAFKDAEGEKK